MYRKNKLKVIVAIAVATVFVTLGSVAVANVGTFGVTSNSENTDDIEIMVGSTNSDTNMDTMVDATDFGDTNDGDMDLLLTTQNTIYVDDDADPSWYNETQVRTIQEGVDNATAGDTVYVYNGTYYEVVTVNKQLYLVGESREGVIVDGSGTGYVFYVPININGVSIDTFTITNGGGGIFLYGVSNTVIIGCDLCNNFAFGIYIYRSPNTKLRNNSIYNNGCNFGIECFSVSEFRQDIDTSNIINEKPIYYLADKSDLLFDETDNIGFLGLISCRNITVKNLDIYGVLLVDTTDSMISNISSHNAKDGIYLSMGSSYNNVVNCNSYSNSAEGIRILAPYNNIINCTVYNNGGEGIGPSCAPYTNIMNCTIYSNGCQGIYCQMSSDHTSITNCNVYNNRYGIQITDTSYLNVLNCDLHDNSDHGLYLFTATNCNIKGCNVYDNDDNGIYIFVFRGDTKDNIIADCNLYNNGYGILTNDYFGSIYDNLIYHNNFTDNTQNANDKYANTWDNGYPSGGNYWDDYSGVDDYSGPGQNIPGSDGIGDTPYNIPGGSNQDNYPLMEAWANQEPDAPTIDGPISGVPDEEYEYMFVSTDPNGDDIYYYIDWGDDTNSGWIGPYDSGANAQAVHSWAEEGDYNIMVKAKDEYGMESSWSDPFAVHIEDMPIIKIGDISGGLFRISAVIKNIGSVDATSVEWSITLDGGLIILGRETYGSIVNIPAGEEVTATSNIIIGFGKTLITVTAECAEGSSDTKTWEGFMFLFFYRLA